MGTAIVRDGFIRRELSFCNSVYTIKLSLMHGCFLYKKTVLQYFSLYAEVPGILANRGKLGASNI